MSQTTTEMMNVISGLPRMHTLTRLPSLQLLSCWVGFIVAFVRSKPLLCIEALGLRLRLHLSSSYERRMGRASFCMALGGPRLGEPGTMRAMGQQQGFGPDLQVPPPPRRVYQRSTESASCRIMYGQLVPTTDLLETDPETPPCLSVMERHLVFDNGLTRADAVVLKNLGRDIAAADAARRDAADHDSGIGSEESSQHEDEAADKPCADSAEVLDRDTAADVARLKAMRDPTSDRFEPTVLLTVDDCASYVSPFFNEYVLQPYIAWAKRITRHDTDVAMITHLMLYFATSVPSAIWLYRNFSYIHGILHVAMQFYYLGTYTLMMHQHIHQRGILAKRYALFDRLFPYVLDPLMGHSWNTYYYHHVKHHHVEGNGPDDLSSTIRYQRDSIADFARYVGRFFFLVWFDLPRYFLRKSRPGMAVRAAGWEFLTYLFYYAMATRFGGKATLFVYLLPFLILRLGLMVGNWGQHAFVDADEPDSDFRSSITLIDVASNRFCFNDGYHTSHHLNPLRHWRDHPISFLEQKPTYAREGALVFHDIDFLMITARLMMKDYEHLARCMVPMGAQIDLTMEGRVALLKTLTRRFSDDEIRDKFRKRT
ncbi:fatty acid desaturase [Purpureocillium lavendulum]|uniref:Fatty acid desaturase n=1 Tax=Purpureocillium lavendulum TaxID=1247861 RepID=A0AB34FZU2_9HYPO|nr:fatty acid desaturase [Purpureocillium lavendulum]